MKSLKIIIVLFLLVAIFQLLVPIKMIYDQENVLNKGKPYKFLTQPIDPNDPFRGKFIRMNYQMNRYKTLDTVWDRDQEIFIYLKDSLGFARLDTVSKEKLDNDKDYVKAKVNWYYNDNNILRFNLPFNRFYMEESKAKPAEDLVRRNRRDTTNITYALVYINKGNFVLEDVFINDVPIKNLIEENKE